MAFDFNWLPYDKVPRPSSVLEAPDDERSDAMKPRKKPSFKSTANMIRVLTRWFENSHQLPVFSVYLSCGPTDTVNERDYLMRWAYPEIRALCAKHGLQFNLVDNRWSLRDETSVFDHHTAR